MLPKMCGEHVNPIERWEISEFKVIALPKILWGFKNPMCMHKWSRNPNSIETNQVIGHYLDRLRGHQAVRSSFLINLTNSVAR